MLVVVVMGREGGGVEGERSWKGSWRTLPVQRTWEFCVETPHGRPGSRHTAACCTWGLAEDVLVRRSCVVSVRVS